MFRTHYEFMSEGVMRKSDEVGTLYHDLERAFKITGIIALSIVGGWAGWAVLVRVLAS